MKMKWKKITLFVLLLMTFCVSMSVLAEEIVSRKLTILQVEGTEAHIKKQNGAKVKAVKGMSLGQGNKAVTGKDSYMYILADDDKTFKLDERTTIAITKESSKALHVEIQDGQVFFNVDKPLASDEELSFKVAHTSMSIRGTSGWLRYADSHMDFLLVEGTVAWDIDGQQIVINPGERVILERDWMGLPPGPGGPFVYRFKEKVPYTWTDMPEDALIAVMENRAKLDLKAIGLDTPEKVSEAAAKVEMILKERNGAQNAVYEDDDDDGWHWVDHTPTSEPTMTASSSNAEPTVPETEATEATAEATEATEPWPTASDLWNISERIMTTVQYNEGVNGNYINEEGSWEWNRQQIYEDGYWIYEPSQGELWDCNESTAIFVDQYDTINGNYDANSIWSWLEAFLSGNNYSETMPY